MNNTWSVPVGARLKCWRTLTRRGHHRIWTLDTDWQRNLWDAWKVHWGLSELSLHGNDGNKGEGWCRGSYQRALVLPFHLFCQAGAAGLGSRPHGGERRGAGVCDAGHRGPSVVLAIRRGVLGEIGESRAEVTLSLGVSDKALDELLWGALEEVSRLFPGGLQPTQACRCLIRLVVPESSIHPLTPA